MKMINLRFLLAAFAAFFIAGSAAAQTAGTVTNHAFAIGKGAGQSGFTSLLCAATEIAIGQSAANPACHALTGDVTMNASGVTAIGAGKVTNAMLAGSIAASKLVGTDIATVGTVTSGTWQATPVGVAYGGTGATTAANARTNLGVVIGTNVQAWDANLDCLAALSSGGVVARTGAGTCATRTVIAPVAGITVSNGDGIAGNPTLALANDLAALEGLSGTGFAVRTGTDAWAQRVISGTANEIAVSNGDGVSGNPTLSLPSALTLTGKTVTGGTFGAPQINSPTGIVKGDVGLGNVNNTSDADKPVSTAQQTALDLKANKATTLTAGTGLAGGGDLSANRTIALSTGSITSLGKADTALQSVVAGINVTVDNTDPRNPIVNASGGGGGSSDPWAAQPIGVPIPLLDNIVGVAQPPTDQSYRYIKLTASDSYNTGVLTSESVTGSAPLVVATAVISLAGSPINGRTVNLINTERRFLRAGSAGTVEQDALQNITGSVGAAGATAWQLPTGAFSTSGGNAPIPAASAGPSLAVSLNFDASLVARTTTETRAKNIGVTFFMRIK